MKHSKTFFLTGFFIFSAFSGQCRAQQIKQLPTCLDFSDVYTRTVLEQTQVSKEEEDEMQSLASILMGYVSALQDIYGNRLVGMTSQDNEWSLMDKVNQYCRQHPQMTFQRAVRSIPAVSQTIQALQDEEFKRCKNYIEQMKPTICSSFDIK